MLSATENVVAPYESEESPPPATLAVAVDEDPLAASAGTVIVKVDVPLAPPAKLREVDELPLIHVASKKTEKESAPFPVLVTL